MSDICKAQVGDACSVTSDVAFGWSSIDWKRVEQNVRCLQIRIAKATREKKWRRVKALQRFLTRSFGGRAMAVRRVTENTGKRTPGVDGELWSTPQSKWDAIQILKRDGYKPSPLRRVYIPKANGKKRPLGIPTMKDRGMQALYLLALAPVAETTADPNSYGFRIARGTHDAIGQVKNLLDKKGSAQWVLEGDILGCFDHISHSWLEAHVPMDRGMLVKWLKAGVMEHGQFSPTKAGTPQGGIISPTLANLALDGLEEILANKFGGRDRLHKHHKRNKVSLVRYADDFIITGSSKELLETDVKPVVEAFLAERGLVLSPDKTVITRSDQGFDFLGWTVRRFGKGNRTTVLVKPSKKNIKAFLEKCRMVFHEMRAHAQSKVIWKLNPILRGWANYHRSEASARTFHDVDHELYKMQWRWACRRHSEKSGPWIKDKYFKARDRNNWVFAGRGLDDRGVLRDAALLECQDVKIKRHTKIKMDANPFDPAWDAYFKDRQLERLLAKHQKKSQEARLLKRQKGLCAHCGQALTAETGYHKHHVIPKTADGTDRDQNLIMIHPVCHIAHHVHHPAPRSVAGRQTQVWRLRKA